MENKETNSNFVQPTILTLGFDRIPEIGMSIVDGFNRTMAFESTVTAKTYFETLGYEISFVNGSFQMYAYSDKKLNKTYYYGRYQTVNFY